jgi:hypothetical protein
MSSLQIKDTGKYKVGGTMESGEARAYGDSGIGTALTLKGAEATLNFESMITDDSPILKKKDNLNTGYFQYGESDSVGIQLPSWTVRGYVSRADSDDMITLGRLIFMCQTKGYKELYSSNDTNFRDIIAYSHYGEREYNAETTKTVSYINVRIKSISVTQSADKKGFFYTLNLVETN